jgi:predicted HAD superfamily Cof-like phosphohydrolase
MTNFDMVREFMNAFEQEVKTKTEMPDKETQVLRYALIHEELNEFVDAMKKEDLVEVADALTDLLYVVYGAGHAFGIDLDKCFAEVQHSNMSKLGEDGKPIYRDDGKVMKGPNFSEPQLKECLNLGE